MNLDWSLISSLLYFLVIPFGVWVVMAIYDLKKEQAINKVIFDVIKEDISEIKESIRQLVDLQYDNPRSIRRNISERKD